MTVKTRSWGTMAVLAVLLLTLLGIANVVYAATLTIDTFDTDLISKTADPGSPAWGGVNSLAAIGGRRNVYVESLAGDTASIKINTGSPASKQAKFSQDSGTRGWGRIVWDGPNTDATVIDKDGLGGKDLTDGGTNDGFQVLVYNFDAALGGSFRLGIWVYSNTQTAYYTLTLSSAVPPPGQSFFISFNQFSGDDIFGDAGAVEFRFAPDTDVDLTVDLFEATAQTDWGDLPESGTSYPTTAANNGARHVRGNLYLGSVIDLEANGFPSAKANGDNNNNYDDEDGILRWRGEEWLDNSTAHITATVTGGSGYLVAWFDWDNDGDFSDETPVQWAVSAGQNALTLTVPSVYDQGNLYARFRLYASDPGTPAYTGQVTNGEVEDYLWGPGPTAVTVAKLAVAPDTGPFRWELAGFLFPVAAVLGLVGAGVWVRRRKQER